jgi:CysZ protein
VKPSRRGSDFFLGLRLLRRGFGMYARSPRLFLLGVVPAVISLAIVATGLFLLLTFIRDVAEFATWFADDWPQPERGLIRFTAGVGIVFGSVMVSVLTYTALTLVIGDPFYEIISTRVEERLGGTPGLADDLPWHRTLRRNFVDSVRLVAFSVGISVPLFAAGFIPIVGQTVVPVVDATVGGWLLALELTGIPFNRRGLRLADRRRLLRANRATALGFGIPVFLILLIPFAGVFVVPAAVAGGTLLTRHLLGLPIDEASARAARSGGAELSGA